MVFDTTGEDGSNSGRGPLPLFDCSFPPACQAAAMSRTDSITLTLVCLNMCVKFETVILKATRSNDSLAADSWQINNSHCLRSCGSGSHRAIISHSQTRVT